MSLYGYAFGLALISAVGLATLITSFFHNIDQPLLVVCCIVIGCLSGAMFVYFGSKEKSA